MKVIEAINREEYGQTIVGLNGIEKRGELIGNNPFFRPPSEKNNPHIRVLAGFLDVLCAKIRDKIHPDSRAFGGLLERGKSAVFWQTG